jgi:hypothetical protein
VYAISYAHLDEIPATLPVPGPRYILLLAADIDEAFPGRIGLAQRILDSGCVYYCGWGAGCSMMDDLIDGEYVVRTLDTQSEGVIMTTWHEASLGEALDFALRHAEPDEAFSSGCNSILLAAVGNNFWHTEMIRLASPYLTQDAI